MDLTQLIYENALAMGIDPNILFVSLLVGLVFSLAMAVIYWVCMALIFEKAQQPWWATIIPIYNVYVLLKITGKPGWWLLLLLIPIVNVFAAIAMWWSLARVFGKGTGFALGLLIFHYLFVLWLAFDGSVYVGNRKKEPQYFADAPYYPATR